MIGLIQRVTQAQVSIENLTVGKIEKGILVLLGVEKSDTPAQADRLPVKISYSLDEVIEKVDVINMLRIQFERLGGNPFPSVREYSHYFGLTVERMKRAKSDILVMHPGPINRGLEIESEVADGRNSVILEQVTNGLAVRMAVLFLVNQAAAQKD